MEFITASEKIKLLPSKIGLSAHQLISKIGLSAHQ